MISYIFSIDQPVKIAHSNEKVAIDFIQIIGRNLKGLVDVFVIIYDFYLICNQQDKKLDFEIQLWN